MRLPDSIQIENHDAREAFEQAYRYQMDGDLGNAVRYYEISLEYERSAEAHTFLGWALSQQDEFDDAIDQCLKAIELDPEFGNPYNDIGVYLLEQGQMERSREWFEKALDAPRYESYCFPHFNLGRIHLMRGHIREAMNHFERALQERPGFTKAREALHRVRNRLN